MEGVASLPLVSLNHISRVTRDVEVAAAFYRDVLGFVEIKRPSSFDFEGKWQVRAWVNSALVTETPTSLNFFPPSPLLLAGCGTTELLSI